MVEEQWNIMFGVMGLYIENFEEWIIWGEL